MKTSNPHKTFLLLIVSILLLSCHEDEPIQVNKLEAKAGEDREVSVNTLVNLDGSESRDGNNQAFAFEWKFKIKPATSNAVLHESASATPKFTPDVAGSYVVELKIMQNHFFKTDVVTITATDVPDPQSPVILNQTIASDRTLEDLYEDPARADYIVTADLIVAATLTVDPGVVIEFESDKSLQIFPEGALIARGTSTERIYFTGKVREKGYWKGILFFSNSPQNELDHVVVDNAGSTPLPEMGNIKTNVALAGSAYSGAAIKVSNSSFFESGGYGIYVKQMSQLNHFSGNYFTNNSASAIFVPAAQLHKLDFHSHYSDNNGYNGVETGGPVNLNEPVTWSYFNDGSKYLVTQDIYIESGVNITEGAAFEFAADRMLKVAENGYLNAVGTDFKPIVFTAQHKTESKFWKGIAVISNHDLNQLRYAIISHAGSSALPEINVKANIGVAGTGKLSVFQSKIEQGLGWGIAADEGSQLNQDLTTSNTFTGLAAGNYKLPASEPRIAALAGEWVDSWSFQNQHYNIDGNYFNQTSATWFNGAEDPWQMNPASGFGLKIEEDGHYTWTIAEHSPSTGCVSYSAEYITGNVAAIGNELTFQENYWRSKFYNSCDTEQNVDFNVQPGQMTLRFEVSRLYDLFTGIAFWELRIINPDGSFFNYYKL